MLLLLFNRTSDPGSPVLSTGYGVLCLHATIPTDELQAAVLIAELEASVLMEELTASVEDVTLRTAYTC